MGRQERPPGTGGLLVVIIGNEPSGYSGYTAWTDTTKNTIGKLRNAGIENALMVDAPNWGQDWSNTMRSNAASVFAADPRRNTIFSIHMYGVYDTAAEVQDYLNHFVENGLPVTGGEFGDNHSDGNPDENAIMATAPSLRVGYLATWGNRFLNGANGISTTSTRATIYGGGDTGGTAPNGYPYCANGTASDPDPDPDGWGWGWGWGWENNRSCVVRGSAADH
ncbi:cellulase family glycosylhydrolase [Streptomyces sp. NPDC085466]|uniref:cellulase family glycosylhydrolase n=1 Tax=Streptomyces sp. NPDC085466 TaxID=3365725 RepID=UPI0037D3134D